MTTFKECDYNLTKIRELSGLGDLKTKREYGVYGLKQQNNPLMILNLKPNVFRHPRNQLKRFFRDHGLYLRVGREIPRDVHAAIGLRRDLRGDVPLASACLQTIIYYLEGKMGLPDGLVLSGIQKFEDMSPFSRRDHQPTGAPKKPGKFHLFSVYWNQGLWQWSGPSRTWSLIRNYPGVENSIW